MRKIVARISESFLREYRFGQSYCNRIPMPIVKYPHGVPERNETCAILLNVEDRWFYNRFHEAAQNDKPGDGIDPQKIPLPEGREPYGTRLVIRVYRLDPPAEKPALYELLAWRSEGKNTRMKSVDHEEPPPDCEELAGGINSSNGTHWCRIAVLLRTHPDVTAEEEREIDEKLLLETA